MGKYCKRCYWYRVYGSEKQSIHVSGVGTFDIEKVLQLISDRGKELQEIRPRALRRLLQKRDVVEKHVAHVTNRRPGILATIEREHYLIDGAHRATRALRERRPFPCYKLTSAETRELISFED